MGYGSFWLIRTLTHGKLGLGDAKYSALIALAAGLRGWYLAMCIASLGGLLWAVLRAGARGRGRYTRIPFAPFLSLGGAVAIVLGRGM